MQMNYQLTGSGTNAFNNKLIVLILIVIRYVRYVNYMIFILKSVKKTYYRQCT